MIIEAIINLFLGLISFIFGLLPIPETPEVIENFLDFLSIHVAEGAHIVTCMFTQSHWNIMLTVVLALFVVRYTYDFIMWILAKIKLE